MRGMPRPWPRAAGTIVLAWALVSCAASPGPTPVVAAVPAPAPTSKVHPETPMTSAMRDVQEIVLERDGEGQPHGLRLRLGTDGRIEHTRTGHARFGTEDVVRTATLSAQEFQALVRLLQAQRFETLDPVYDDPETAGGGWALLRVTHPEGQTQVWWRAGHRPTAVQPLEAAVLELGRRAGPVPPSAR
jgi:hypothetical protein